MAGKKAQEEIRKAMKDAETRASIAQSAEGRDEYWDGYAEALAFALRTIAPKPKMEPRRA